jgi:hypothetical protein
LHTYCLLSDYHKIDKGHLDTYNINTGKYYLENLGDIGVNKLSKYKLNKNIFGKLIRIITNSAFTNETKYRVKISESPSCTCGSEIQSINHLFWACPILLKERKILIKSFLKQGLQLPLSIEYVLNNLNKKIMKAITKFLSTEMKDCNIKKKRKNDKG